MSKSKCKFIFVPPDSSKNQEQHNEYLQYVSDGIGMVQIN